MIGQAIDACFPPGGDKGPLLERRQPAGRARRVEERVPETIVVEHAVNVSAECAAARIDCAIRADRRLGLALNLGERHRAFRIDRLSQLNLVALKAWRGKRLSE